MMWHSRSSAVTRSKTTAEGGRGHISMNKLRFAVALALLAVASGCASRSTGHDPDIDAIVQHIDPARIRQTVNQLASFQTRHTLSDSDNPTRGIGAARRWIKQQF